MSLSELGQGGLWALLGAALGYGFGYWQKHQEEKRRRRGIATALLAELRPLERMLRVRAEHTKAAESTVQIRMDVFDGFESDLPFFDPTTTHALLELRGYVRDIEHTADTIATGRGKADEKANHYMRLKASAAANCIPKAVELLEAAGGIRPLDPKLDRYGIDQLPPLLDPAFPNASNLRP